MLMLGTGIGSEVRQPLSYAIVGGLVVSQLLTLFTTPVVYIYLDQPRGEHPFVRPERTILSSRMPAVPGSLVLPRERWYEAAAWPVKKWRKAGACSAVRCV